MSGEVSPIQMEGWRTPGLCFCYGAELKAMRQGLSPERGSCWPLGSRWVPGGGLWNLAVALTSLPFLCPSSSQWC